MKARFANNMLGVAGELRVMSELLLHGFNPAKSYLDNGIDVVLSNGVKIQVKARRKSLVNNSYYYCFSLMSARYRKGKQKKEKQNLEDVDFLIVWGVDTNAFYIIPVNIVKDTLGVSIPLVPAEKSNVRKYKYDKFKNNWNLLKSNSKGKR